MIRVDLLGVNYSIWVRLKALLFTGTENRSCVFSIPSIHGGHSCLRGNDDIGNSNMTTFLLSSAPDCAFGVVFEGYAFVA
jgi:hypothetical protein